MESNNKRSHLENDRDNIKRNYLNPLKMDALQSSRYEEETRLRPDGPFQRDYARIMYSSSFRRLQGKMQLLGIKNDQFFRNRLTHSLEVAQIARSIAGAISYDSSETYIVEGGALAHDLGNPPFGHAGERCLNELFSDIGGFEGNAQTLRILTNIEQKRPNFRGLNLTYRTLFSIVKYFKKYDPELFKNNKSGQKFIYDDDYNMLKVFIDEYDLKIRTLDVQIVDIADEIAYAAHDLEDGLRIKAYTMDEILYEYRTKYGNSSCYKKLEELVESAKTKAGYCVDKRIDSMHYSKLFRQELASSLINLALNDVGLKGLTVEKKEITGSVHSEELSFLEYEELINGLKQIVFKCINHNDEVHHYEKSGEIVLKYLQELYKNDIIYLPPEYRAKELMQQYDDLNNYNIEKLQDRLICDYLAGMMDSYAIRIYEKFSGMKFGGSL